MKMQKPQLEVVKFSVRDIIVTSGMVDTTSTEQGQIGKEHQF